MSEEPVVELGFQCRLGLLQQPAALLVRDCTLFGARESGLGLFMPKYWGFLTVSNVFPRSLLGLSKCLC